MCSGVSKGWSVGAKFIHEGHEGREGVEVFEMIAERFRKQQRMKGREEGLQEGMQKGEQKLARRLLSMSDAERKLELERIVNGDG